MIILYSLCLGLLGSTIVAFFAYILQALTLSGCVALMIVGALAFTFAPSGSWLLLFLFFGSSLLIHRLKNLSQKIPSQQLDNSGTIRNGKQVFANSAPFLLTCIAYFFTKEMYWLIACGSTLAGAAADTWSSEVGALSKKAPRNILDFRREKPGSSGAVSILGTWAAVFASLLIAGSFYLLVRLFHPTIVSGYFFILPLLCGFSDSLIDSVLGATLQAKYLCIVCGKKTEKRNHHGQPALLVHGFRWLTNDGVNFLSGLLTLVLSIILTLWFY